MTVMMSLLIRTDDILHADCAPLIGLHSMSGQSSPMLA
jgi:hypothetical protein